MNDWLIWQLADSAFPTGGFAHSGGLEAAWQHGEVRDSEELFEFLQASLNQAGHAALPFVQAAHGEPQRLGDWDRLCEAFLSNHVANRASRAQGLALLAASQKSFKVNMTRLPRLAGHFAPMFGAVTNTLAVSAEQSARLFLFVTLRGLVSSAVRLGIVGPMEAQAIQHRLAPQAETVAARCGKMPVEEIAHTAPLLEIWGASQDRLYSRLFQT